MITKIFISAMTLMMPQDLPNEVGINYLPLETVGLNLSLSPAMLGEKPKLFLKNKAQIASLLDALKKVKTDRVISPQFVHFVFRFNGKTIYVDCDGVVQGVGQNYIVDPGLLEKRILALGYPPAGPNQAIPPEWQ